MNEFLKTYGGHLAAYLTAALGVFQYTDPTVLGPKGALIIAIVGALAGAASNVHVATSEPVAPVASKAALWLLTAFVALTALTGLTACKTVPTPTQSAVITVAVDIATGAAIQNGASTDTYTSRAVRFKQIAQSVKAVNDAGTATLATLAADLEPQLVSLPPADQLAARALVAALTPYLNQQISVNPQLANVQATLDIILQAVIDSCASYGA